MNLKRSCKLSPTVNLPLSLLWHFARLYKAEIKNVTLIVITFNVVLVYKFPFRHFCTQLLTRKYRARPFYALLLAFDWLWEKQQKLNLYTLDWVHVFWTLDVPWPCRSSDMMNRQNKNWDFSGVIGLGSMFLTWQRSRQPRRTSGRGHLIWGWPILKLLYRQKSRNLPPKPSRHQSSEHMFTLRE